MSAVLAGWRSSGFQFPLALVAFVPWSSGCSPELEEAAGRLRASIEASQATWTDEIESALTPRSRYLLQEVSARGWLQEALDSLRESLTVARPVSEEPGLLRGNEPSQTLFFVRDGYGLYLDLPLSGAWFSELHALQYPKPW